MCKTRWTRHSLADAAQSTTPQGTDLVTYGKYLGSTYKHIYDEYLEYASWVLQSAQQEPQTPPPLLHLAAYLRGKSASIQQVMQIGSDQMTYPTGETYIASGVTSDELMDYPEERNGLESGI